MSEPSSSCSSPTPSSIGEDNSSSICEKEVSNVHNKGSSSSTSSSETSNKSLPKANSRKRGRGGITFLSGDPMKIGLIGKKGSLTTVVRALQQKKLLKRDGTLEKSRLDWQSFKKAQGIEEELQTQIKSKNGYLERQDFLKRSDLREFEIEKELRAKKRRLANNSDV